MDAKNVASNGGEVGNKILPKTRWNLESLVLTIVIEGTYIHTDSRNPFSWFNFYRVNEYKIHTEDEALLVSITREWDREIIRYEGECGITN